MRAAREAALTPSNELELFEKTYTHHVAMVKAGDLQGVMADMHPDAVPGVFKGADVPRGEVHETDIRSVRLENGRGVGECVYTTPDGRIGLRSGWVHDGVVWKADSLENFDA